MKNKHQDYGLKFEKIKPATILKTLPQPEQDFLRQKAFELLFTQGELKKLSQISADLLMWQQPPLSSGWSQNTHKLPKDPKQQKQHMLKKLEKHVHHLCQHPSEYPAKGLVPPPKPEPEFCTETRPGKIAGLCPVASDLTICCRLRTIDAVMNCGFGCSYCIIQSFYDKNRIIFDSEFEKKLTQIEIDPEKYYHFGSGQSSDSLMWGNRNNILGILVEFARKHPNVLLELKTKSAAVEELIKLKPPKNVVCSWSLNTNEVIKNEEHFTPDLDQRIAAARKVAQHGIFTAFHFHPMLHTKNWQADYTGAAHRVMENLPPEQVLFVSFGTVTFIKPVIKQIRQRARQTLILQTAFSPDPHGKLTYPDQIKVKLFKNMATAFSPWKDKVFQYLCMEKKSIWLETFGWSFADSFDFEEQFLRAVFTKIGHNIPENKKIT